jgi:Flp pilus assembly protein TadD
MKRNCRTLLLSLLGFLILSASSVSAQQYGTIVGEVHVARADFPSQPILVELQLRGAAIASVYTDGQGRFGFHGLGSNPYHVVIHDDAFYPVDELAKLDLSITSTLMVQVHLLPRRQAQKEPLVTRAVGSNPGLVDPKEYRRHFPKKALKEFDKGVQADRNGKHDDAIRYYEEALHIAPDFYPARNNLGSDYLSRSDFRSAREEFEQAVKLNESDAEAHLNLANVFLQTKNYEGALKNVQEGLRRQPDSAFGMFLLGSIYERMGRAQEAEKALHEALQLDPNMSRIHLELVNLYLAEQKPTEAKAELQAFLKQFPGDPLAPRAREVLAKLQNSK